MRSLLSSLVLVLFALFVNGSAVPAVGADAAAPAGPRPKAACRSASLSPKPAWLTSGFWDGGQLVAVDAKYGEFLRLSSDGRSHAHTLLNDTIQNPARVSPYDAGIVVELVGDRMVAFDERYIPIRARDVRSASVQTRRHIDKISSWTPVGNGKEIVAFADIQELTGRKGWSNAFVRFPLDNPAHFRPIQDPHRDPSPIFYRLGYPYLTAVGDTAYILLLDSGVGLYRNRKRSDLLEPVHSLERLALASQLTPMLPSFGQKQDFAAVMRAVERSSMPAGLYAWEGDLYVLWRARKGGATEWTLHRVDAESEQLVSSVTLPTLANHLTVVPGSSQWAFIEKGPVRAHRDQDVNSVLFVPSGRIRQIKRGDVCR